jgi:hypothetical protein
MNSLINGDGANCVRPPQNPNWRLPSVVVPSVNNSIQAAHIPVLLTPTVICDRPACVSASRLLLDESIRTPEELVPGLLHMGTKGMLVGASKCGKTWLLMDLAISVATGTPFLRCETNVELNKLGVAATVHLATFKDTIPTQRILREAKSAGIKGLTIQFMGNQLQYHHPISNSENAKWDRMMERLDDVRLNKPVETWEALFFAIGRGEERTSKYADWSK